MRKLALAIGALALTVPATMPFGTAQAAAAGKHKARHVAKRCRHSKGTTGLIVGGVGGALVGRAVLGHGLLGTAAGAAGGALAGRAIDRSMTAKKRGCR